MPLMGTTRDKQRYQKWWDKNRARVLKRRREKYQQNAQYRLRTIQRVRQRYWANRPKLVLKTIRRKVEPSFTMKTAGGKLAVAYGLADVAKLYGRSMRTILFWEKTGVLPPPLYVARERRSIRVYSEDEFALMRKHSGLLGYPKKTLVESVFARTLRRDVAYLRRGLLTIEKKEDV